MTNINANNLLIQQIPEPFEPTTTTTFSSGASHLQTEQPMEIFPRDYDEEDEYNNPLQYEQYGYQEHAEENRIEESCDEHYLKLSERAAVTLTLDTTKIADAVPNTGIVTVGTLTVLSLDALLSLSLPPREMLLSPFLPSQGLAMIAAARGVGKTHVALGITYAVTTGGTFLKWSAPKPKKVLYIDGEMPFVLLQERFQMIVQMNDGKKPTSDFLQILTPDRQDTVMPDLSTPQGREAIEPLIAGVDLAVIDNISSLFRRGSENEAETWQAAQDWALDWRRRGKSILFVHHTGRNGLTPRGNSKREDILDTVVILKNPEGYDASEGARFEIHFTKARQFRGEDATPFEAHLTEDNGVPVWRISSIAPEALTEEVAELFNAGSTIDQIKKTLKLTKSQVETQLKHARKKEIITR